MHVAQSSRNGVGLVFLADTKSIAIANAPSHTDRKRFPGPCFVATSADIGFERFLVGVRATPTANRSVMP